MKETVQEIAIKKRKLAEYKRMLEELNEYRESVDIIPDWLDLEDKEVTPRFVSSNPEEAERHFHR